MIIVISETCCCDYYCNKTSTQESGVNSDSPGMFESLDYFIGQCGALMDDSVLVLWFPSLSFWLLTTCPSRSSLSSLSWRWVATQSLHPSPWAFSSPPSPRRLPLLPRSRSTVCRSQSCGTSSSVSRTSRTSVLLSAVFTSAFLSSLSHKVGVNIFFLPVPVCLSIVYNDTSVHRKKQQQKKIM